MLRELRTLRSVAAVGLCALALLAAGSASSAAGSYESQLATARAELIAMRDGLATPQARLWLSRSVASLGWAIGADCWTNSGSALDPVYARSCFDALRTTINRLVLNGAPLRDATAAQQQAIVQVVLSLAVDSYNLLPSATPADRALLWKVHYDFVSGGSSDRPHALDAYIRAWTRMNGPLGPAKHATIGETRLLPKLDYNPAGQAEAFEFFPFAKDVQGISVYVDPSSTARSLVAGIYADRDGGPGELLAQGSTPLAQGGGEWNTVHFSDVGVTRDVGRYWIAILTPAGDGTLRFRDRCCRGAGTSMSVMSQETNLTSLPATWTPGLRFKDGPLSAFGLGWS